MKISLLAAVCVAMLPSCALKMGGVCVAGPNKGGAVKGTASWNGMTGTGTIKATAPWGETASGRYLTMLTGGSIGEWNMKAKANGINVDAFGSDLNIRADGNTQVGTALLLGNQGTTFDVIYWASMWSPTHGQGKMMDSRGNFYKLLW